MRDKDCGWAVVGTAISSSILTWLKSVGDADSAEPSDAAIITDDGWTSGLG